MKVYMKSFCAVRDDNIEGKVDPNIIIKLLPNCTVPNDASLRCISERQLDHGVSDIFGVDKINCRHGHPRAFVQYPVGVKAMSSGMLRLSCPYLVKAVDEFENDGGIEEVNKELASNTTLQSAFLDINKAWANIRNTSTSSSDRSKIKAVLGVETEEQLMNSGIIGITLDKVDDVKCLHAHIADAILRGEEKNVIGSLALKLLQERKGVSPLGCVDCREQCDSTVPKKQGWWYTPAKNKQKLRTTKIRRTLLRTPPGNSAAGNRGDE